MIRLICGSRRALDVAHEDVSVCAERDDSSWMRAPRVVECRSRAPDLRGEIHDLAHLFAITSPSEPPNTVKSWLKTHTVRPSIVRGP